MSVATARRDFFHPVVKDVTMPLWCIEYMGLDPFGQPVLTPIDALRAVDLACEAVQEGLITGTSLHDCDLVPWNPDDPEDDLKEGLVKDTVLAAKAKLDAVGAHVNTVTCNLHAHPMFRKCALTNPDPRIRDHARLKARRAARIGNVLGAKHMTHWIAREGYTSPAEVDWRNVMDLLVNGLDDLTEYVFQENMSMTRLTEETKPYEPLAFNYVPTAGHGIALINRLQHPERWGQNPELRQHEGMIGLDSLTCVTTLVGLDKLFFLHFGNQVRGQMDQDFPPFYGPEGLEETAYLFWVLELLGWSGTLEFDCHMIRSDANPADPEGCRRKFIAHCCTALHAALTIAARLRDLPVSRIGGGAEADFAAKCLMTGLDPQAMAKLARGQK